MAFTYKQIGNTAAAVASLLAVGTLCWWQRTPGPLNAPRPQDEAEIMTACLERHYAMGRTGTQFTITRPAYVMQSGTNGATVTNAAFTLTNTVGFFPNAPDNYGKKVKDAFAWRSIPGFTSDHIAWLSPSSNYYSTGVWDVAGDIDAMTSRWAKCLSAPTPASNVSYIPSTTDETWWTQRVAISYGGTNKWTVPIYDAPLLSYEDRIFPQEGGWLWDNKKRYWWSTNIYNDLSRPLSIMQWQNAFLSPRSHEIANGLSIKTITRYGYAKATIADNSFPEIDYGATTYSESDVFLTSSEFYIYQYSTVDHTNTQIEIWVSTGWLIISNSSPFVYTNGVTRALFTKDSKPFTNSISRLDDYVESGTMTHTMIDSCYTNGMYVGSSKGGILNQRWSLAPGETFEVRCGFNFLNLSDIENYTLPWFLEEVYYNIHPEYLANGNGGEYWYTGKTYNGPYSWPRNNDVWSNYVGRLYFWTAIDPFGYVGGELSPAFIDSFYRVQFSSLTNYLNHAPAR